MDEKPKVGMTKTYDIDGAKVVMKPVTLGKMKKAMTALLQPGAESIEALLNYFTIILDNGENPTINRQWLEDHLTMPTANQMIADNSEINGMGQKNFLTKGGPVEVLKEKDLEERNPATPSA